jgi:hypothetical protein
MKIKSHKNFWSALIFLVAGAFIGIYGYTHYQYGSALRMGPGYFPTWLGALTFLIGVMVMVQSFTLEGQKVPRFHWRPMLFVLGGVVLFGYILKPAGLVLSIMILASVSAYGGHEFKWKEVVWLAIALAIFSVLVFVKLLGQPFPIWPAFID